MKIPENLPKVYAIGAAGGFTPYDFRVLFFDAGRVQPEAKVEVTLSPIAAKELRNWLDNLVKDFEKNVRKIDLPGEKLEGKKPAGSGTGSGGSTASTMRMFG
jgi:hypothetical protein